MSSQSKTAHGSPESLVARVIHRWGFADERDFLLRVVQPGLVGLIDGTISSLAPIFAAAITSSSHTAFGRPRGCTRCGSQHGLVGGRLGHGRRNGARGG